MFEVRITREGLRHLDRLPEKVRQAALEAIHTAVAVNPLRVGKDLRGELEGLLSARRGDYRIICEVDEDRELVTIHRVQHRLDAYRGRR